LGAAFLTAGFLTGGFEAGAAFLAATDLTVLATGVEVFFALFATTGLGVCFALFWLPALLQLWLILQGRLALLFSLMLT
jgi:hypothetical protein